MRRKTIGQFAMMFLVALCLGCSGNNLTRDRAQELIEATKKFQPTSQLTLTDQEFEAGQKAGYFIYARGEWQYCKLTPQGQAFFGIEHLYAGAIILRTKTPVRLKVLEITGIVGNDTAKEARYVYGLNLDDFPEGLRPIFQDLHQKGVADFRKYDDGWRVESH